MMWKILNTLCVKAYFSIDNKVKSIYIKECKK